MPHTSKLYILVVSLFCIIDLHKKKKTHRYNIMMHLSSQNIHDYLNTALDFLSKEQWIYNYPNTHILANKVLDNFQEDWLPHLINLSNEEINCIPFGYINDKWPSSLKLLLENILFLKKDFNSYEAIVDQELPIKIYANPKKIHEIVSLAALINEKCQEENISYIVDAGAGLGYLSQLLYKQYGYRVLAIEGDTKYYEIALKNQEVHYPDSKEFVVYLNHFITKDLANDLKCFLQQHFPDWNEKKTCIVGLHACADLSVTILELYSKLDFVQSMIAMPCCYHRLQLQSSTEEGERFVNFPVSNTLVSLYMKLQGEYFLKRPFLRLGCQQSRYLWKKMTLEDHEKHYKSCIFRAIVQEVSENENLTIRRLKRKTGKLKVNSDLNIDDYIDNLKNTHELIEKGGGNELPVKKVIDKEFENKISKTWSRYKDSCFLVEVLTAFQTAIQNICENVVLLDRVAFLQESGLECEIYKVTNEEISPRCHALVANKM